MQAEYREQLPDNVHQLLDRIEKFAGFEILVAPNPQPPAEGDPNPNAPAIEVGATHATILIRTGHFAPHDIVHELLHAHRFWIESVPQLVPAGDDPEHWKITSEVENALEHTVIVLREAKYFPDPFAYWNQTCAANWAAFPNRYQNAFARRKAALLAYLAVQKLVTSDEVKADARAALDQAGLRADAELFAARVAHRIAQQKAQAIAITVDMIGIPRAEVRLLYLDPRKGTEKRIEVPDTPA